LLNRNTSTGRRSRELGFTIVELMVVIMLIGILSGMIYGSFNGVLGGLITLQKENLNLNQMSNMTQRIGSVVRGATDIVSATKDDVVLYAYFAPADTYVSQVHYYKNAANTILYVDVTRMTANPPTGVPIPATKTTYALLNPYTEATNTKLFRYLNASGTELTTPISDLHTIKGVTITLSVPNNGKNPGYAQSLTVSLRNRKTNL
jgi:prepilin-type N-terminal cleavage/methylation domain-containing protein